MRFQVALILILCSLSSFAKDDKSMQELFKNYSAVMDFQKVELINEVFTEKFIKDSGGKKELIEKIKELPLRTEKSLPTTVMTWKKTKKEEVYLAHLKEISQNKHMTASPQTEFIVKKEKGKLKIDGTVSDGD